MFNNSHDFYIKNLYASDGGGNDVVAMAALDKLANAACLGAGHQSDEGYDAPKCHPETRAAVLKDIMSWVNAKDSKEPIIWMSGPAGAGKSAIAQIVCEKCHREKKLLASFFFSRTATGTGRSEGKRLVPTIACQLAIAIPEVKVIIIKQLEQDSTSILSYTMEKLLQALVLEPLAEMHKKSEQDKSCIDVHIPYVVVIDGLDECNDPNEQSRIVRMISGIFGTGQQEQIQLRFLIASRPELEIRNSFESIIDSGMCAQIVLNQEYNPNEDIRTYLRSEFVALKREHTLRQYLKQDIGWPFSGDINNLVWKSSGQFIYASTVIKYLRDPRRDPRQGLRDILDTDTVQSNSNQNESPYIALDSLYKHVLASSSTSYELYKIIFQVLFFSLKGRQLSAIALRLTLRNLTEFTGMTQSELQLRLADLHSLVYIPDWNTSDEIKFYHASFGDFLKDESRSQNFYISEPEAHKNIAQRCLSRILEMSSEIGWYMLKASQKYSLGCFFRHLQNSDFDEELLTMLRSETTLHTVLEFLFKHKLYDSLNHIIIFSFNGRKSASQPYWIPRTEKIQDICLAIVKFVEERFLIKMHSVGTLNGDDVVQALFYSANIVRPHSVSQNEEFYFNWLQFLLGSPVHGNYLYLDSENSLLLYKKLIQKPERNTWKHYALRGDTYFPIILKYLLQKIQPSADIDIDLFPRSASGKVSSDITQKVEDKIYVEHCIEDLNKVTQNFVTQCQVMKQKEEERNQNQKEDFRLKQDEELKTQQEEQQTRRSFRKHIITTIKYASSKLKDKL